MKHSLCVLLCIILLCGCTNTVEHHPVNTVESENEIIQEETVVGKTMITPADDSWKYEVAERCQTINIMLIMKNLYNIILILIITS